MKRNYIGLSTTIHDPAIAIINSEGNIVFAEAAERYLQNKRGWNCIPDDIVRCEKLLKKYCDEGSKIVTAFTWSKKRLILTKLFKPLIRAFAMRRLPYEQFLVFNTILAGKLANFEDVGCNLLLNNFRVNNGSKVIKRYYDHHLTHAAAACYSSPFHEAVCAVVDGFGEYSSTAFFSYKNGKITRLSCIKPSRVSLGLFYWHLCTASGWDPIKGEEGKVMGLAPYGKYDKNIYERLRSLIQVKNCKLIKKSTYKDVVNIMNKMRRNPYDSPLKSADLAYNGQLVFSEIMFEILNHLYQYKISDNLVLTGGCALNSSCNGKILKMTPFKDLYVFSAPADDGNAVGAALLAYYEDNPPKSAPAKFQTPYLGESLSPDTINKLEKLGKLKNRLPAGKKIYEQAAKLLAEGKIIGWVQGRAEFGPRALGNRSILADPRSIDIKKKINDGIKFREEFRPFAPSILNEYGHEYFEEYKESPYMERTLKFRKEVIKKVPGVVHVDNTGRLQTVKSEWNKKFYNLIATFKEITGIPLILNTSFNIMGKPIIHSIENAIAFFFTSGIDALVIEDRLYMKDIS